MYLVETPLSKRTLTRESGTFLLSCLRISEMGLLIPELTGSSSSEGKGASFASDDKDDDEANLAWHRRELWNETADFNTEPPQQDRHFDRLAILFFFSEIKILLLGFDLGRLQSRFFLLQSLPGVFPSPNTKPQTKCRVSSAQQNSPSKVNLSKRDIFVLCPMHTLVVFSVIVVFILPFLTFCRLSIHQLCCRFLRYCGGVL